ncbi:MAG TPA: hypothetical protein VIO64_22185 [Pseudobacteroides sp.]|uniref:CDI toxin immunity protein n=1 Tax=Pseudobacteroides sp. TaxID=1968840 RepID=UPI002F923806
MATLLDECLDALGDDKEILSYSETSKIFKSFISTFPITKWGVIDWSGVDKKYIVSKAEEIKHIFKMHKPESDIKVYILWNDNSLPSIAVDMDKAMKVIDDVTAVSFDTWLYNDKEKYVIEFHHEGLVTLGFA